MTSRPVIETYEECGLTRVSRWIWNCYVIHEGPVVVDAGLPTAADDIAPIIDQLGGTVRSVVATHAHSDHVAGAAAVAARFGAQVYLPARSLDYLAGEAARTPRPKDQARLAPILRDQPFDVRALSGLVRGTRLAGFGLTGHMRWQGPEIHSGLGDTATVPGAPAWTTLAAPGHTDDSIAFWHAPSATLLSGDAVLTRHGNAWFTPEVVDEAAARRTDEALSRLAVSHLFPGHGAPVHARDVWERARAASDHRQP